MLFPDKPCFRGGTLIAPRRAAEDCFMNESFAAPDTIALTPIHNEDVVLDGRGRLALYLAVGLAAGAVIALQIDIMRVFAVGSWAHFGSLVVSLAMLGFGLTSAVM